MKGMTDAEVLGFNRGIIEQFRTNGGRIVEGRLTGNPTLLMTMTGAKTGRELTSPLTYDTDGDDLIVMGSAGGDPAAPAWVFNLRANPSIVLEVATDQTHDQGIDRYGALATETSGEERQALFESFTKTFPRFADYQAGVEREIPIFRLTRAV